MLNRMMKNSAAIAKRLIKVIKPAVTEDFSVTSILSKSNFFEANSFTISTIIFFLKLQKKELRNKVPFNFRTK